MTKRESHTSTIVVKVIPRSTQTDPAELSALVSLGLIYVSETQGRLFRFLNRNNLSDKFTEEDEAGKR